jgi:PAS domain S-box-containing protein
MLNSLPLLTQSELISAIVSQPLVVTPDSTVMAAIAQMSGIRVVCSSVRDSQLDELQIQARSSCVSVVENGQLIGILTERDIVRLSAEQRDLDNLAIRDVMTTNVVTLKAADFTDIFIAVNLFQQHHIRHLPVVDDRHCLVGLLTHESLQRTIRPVDLLRLRLVSEVMTAVVICAAPDASILEISQLMAKHRISSVTIVRFQMDDGQNLLKIPIGIITERDLVQFQALNLNLETCEVRAVMSTPVFAVNPNDSLWSVQQILERKSIQRLVVTGDRGELVGIVTQSSLLKALNPLELYNLAEALEAKVVRLEAEKIQLLEHRTIDLEHQVEERTKKLTSKIAHEQSIGKISTQIRAAGNLNGILDTAVQELQSILGCDRVSIWKFLPDGRTLEVVADWHRQDLPSLGQQVFDPCFSPAIYINGKVRTISDIYTAQISPCHRDLLVDLKIRSKILVPILAILDDSIPWGLMSAIESDRSREWESDEIELFQQIATQMAIAIQQATAYERVQTLNTELESRVEQRTAQLQEREAQLQDFFDSANDLIQSVSLADGKFEYVNRSWQDTLGYTTAEIDRLTIFDILHPDCRHHCQELIQQLKTGIVTTIDRIELKLLTKTQQEAIVEGSLNCRYVDGQAVATRGIFRDISAAKQAEFARKQNEQIVRQQAERESVLREITQRIRKSLDLKTIFETAVREIRQFMATDRVGIFKFNSKSNFGEGEFIAESVDLKFESIVGIKVCDPNFGNKLAKTYQHSKIDLLENIDRTGLWDDLMAALTADNVQANLVVPLLNGPVLWGLLCIHDCTDRRSWQESEINFVTQIAEQIGIGIHQATLYEKVQLELDIRWEAEAAISLQLRQQQALGEIAKQIRNSLQVEEILATATVQVKELIEVDRVSILRVFPNRLIRVVEEVVSPEYCKAIDRNWAHKYINQEEFEFYLHGQPNIVFDLDRVTHSTSLQECIDWIGTKSEIIVPILLLSGSDRINCEIDTGEEPHLWGLLCVHTCSVYRQWQDVEVKLLQQIADQLAIAIQQASLFEKLQQELTERQQAEIQLQESNDRLAVSNEELARATRRKDEFLAGMSHELRTPLNSILGMSESLQAAVFGTINERQNKSICTIEKSGKHLLALINDILDLSKIEANKFELELADISITSLCQNSIVFVKELAYKRQIQLKTQLPEALKYLNLQVDDLRFRQVLINLLSNAVKFTPEHGNITLDVRVDKKMGEGVDGWMSEGVDGVMGGGGNSSTFEPDDLASIGQNSNSLAPSSWHIAFSVIDTGIGIAPENMDKLFQSFVQIDSSLSRQYAGTGLGLSLAKRIVEMHGGTISVQSEVNRGSCFTVCLPFEPSPEIAHPLSSPLLDSFAANIEPETLFMRSQTSILLVEDNEGNMETMTTYLESRGYRLIAAENGPQALSILESCTNSLGRSGYPQIVLMDIQMPGMDGFEAIDRIRQIPEFTQIPIVALTALAMPDDCQRCLDAGADRYVSKPVKLSQLVTTIETLLTATLPS